MDSPLQVHTQLSNELGVELILKRDDLLPFPLAGNKYRKLVRELAEYPDRNALYITNGAVSSNHCRTLAILAAEMGQPVHLVLHEAGGPDVTALALLRQSGASYDIVAPSGIRQMIEDRTASYEASGYNVHVVPGGCHSPAGAAAYRDATLNVLQDVSADVIYVASGTGATQGGIAAGAQAIRPSTRVVGVSVARECSRGREAVLEAAAWAGFSGSLSDIEFTDKYRDGGYGQWTSATQRAVEVGWRNGIPLDPVYTGKAFRALLADVATGEVPANSTVLFWHTGGLWNALHAASRTRAADGAAKAP